MKKRIYELGDRINFGKYSEFGTNKKTIKEIIDIDPNYISWCLQTVKSFFLSEEAGRYYKENK